MSKRSYPLTLFPKVIVPVIYGCEDCQRAVTAALAIAGDAQVILVGVVGIPAGEPISAAAGQAREVRKAMTRLALDGNTRLCEPVRVSYQPWEEVRRAVEQEGADLLVLAWPDHTDALQTSYSEILANPPCSLAILAGPLDTCPRRLLVAMRGGPYAELALRISLAMAQSNRAQGEGSDTQPGTQITALHITPPDHHPDAPYRGIEHVLENLPEVVKSVVQTDDAQGAIVEHAAQHDLTILGATGRADLMTSGVGPVASRILARPGGTVLVVKTKQPIPRNFEASDAGQTAISVLVDQWFAENTYHADEFEDLRYLLALKERQGTTISLALPALNEEETVGMVIQTVKSRLMDEVPLLDEIVLIDSNSSDRTREIAAELGVPVHIHQEMLPRYGARRGKGEALWKSLYATRGDIVLWIDTDIVNIHPRFVYGLIGPLLLQPEIQFVKGFYRRPLKVDDKIQASGGGRVTELTARPLINLFYPEISGVIQPLSGEYGGRRSALEQMSFFSGYGVEIGLLIDVFEKYGLQALAQVDLQERIHHNQSLESLSKMSFAIIQAIFSRLERRYSGRMLEDINKTMKLIRYEPGRFFLDVEEIAEKERPPMVLLQEYRESFGVKTPSPGSFPQGRGE